MTARALLQQVHGLGVMLTSAPEGGLHYKAPTGVLTPVLLAGLRQHKAALLALLAPPGRVDVTRCTRLGPHNYIKQFAPITRESQWRCSLCNALQEVLLCR